MIDFVVFDLGGVLCDVELERGRARCLALGYSLEVFASIEASGAKYAGDRGRMDIGQMLQAVRSHCHDASTLTRDDLLDMWGAVVSWRDYVPRILARMRVEYGVLSVIDPIHAKVLGPLPGAAPVTYSCHIGQVKPDHAAYHELVAQCPHPARRILFVDDRPENVLAAQQCGLQAQCVHDETSLVQALHPVLWLTETRASVEDPDRR